MSNDYVDKVAGVEFALALRFLARIHGMNMPADVLQRAIDNTNHPLWRAVEGALLPEEMPISPGRTLKKKGGEGGTQVASRANPQVFNPAEKFVINTHDDVPMKIARLSNNFQRWMPQMLSVWMSEGGLEPLVLSSDMTDSAIIDRVGGVQKVIASLEEVWNEMVKCSTRQDQGRKILRGHGKVFYVPQMVDAPNKDCFTYLSSNPNFVVAEVAADSRYLFQIQNRWFVLRTVLVGLGEDGWCVSAFPIACSRGWREGTNVFHRNSVSSHAGVVLA